MSFCDPDKPKGQHFLGVAFVDAETLTDAVTQSHLTGCNPGGEIQIVGVPHDKVPNDKREAFLAAPRNILMDRATLERLGLM